MPVFPVMNTVANAKLQWNVLFLHCLEKLDIALQQKVIVATINKPSNTPQLSFCSLISIKYILYAIVLFNGFRKQSHLTLRILLRGICIVASFHLRHSHQCTHRICSAMLLVANDAISLLYIGKELGVEECFIFPARHIEIAIPNLGIDIATSIRC